MAPYLYSLGLMLNLRYSFPDRKGYIYFVAIDWMSAVQDCGQWVVLYESVQIGYFTAEVKCCVLRCKSSAYHLYALLITISEAQQLY